MERWLSYLADDQPWLSPGDNLRNHRDFRDVSELLHEELTRCEQLALSTAKPQWLAELSQYWVSERSTVITFNYDTLVERALDDPILARDGSRCSWAYLSAMPLLPARATSGRTYGWLAPKEGLPQLLKLHGSLNWRYGGPDSPPSEPVYMTTGSGGWHLPSAALDREQPMLPANLWTDQAPMVVPPTATKTAYYASSTRSRRGSDPGCPGDAAQWRPGMASERGDLLVVVQPRSCRTASVATAPGFGGGPEEPSSIFTASPMPPGRPTHWTPAAPPLEIRPSGRASMRSVSSRPRPATRYGCTDIADRIAPAAAE